MTNNISSKEEFEKLSSEEKLQADMEIRQEVFEAIQSKDLVRIEEAEKKLDLLPEESRKEIRNVTWQTHKLRIVETITGFLKAKNRMPSAIELAQEVNVTPPTIYKHLREIREQGFQDEDAIFHSLKGKLMNVLVASALRGDTRSAKLCLDMLNGADAKPSTVIQINGNIEMISIVNTLLPFIPESVQEKAKLALMKFSKGLAA